MNINIIRPSVEIKSIKLKDVKAGDVFYIQGADDVPYLKMELYYKNGLDYVDRIDTVNLLNGEIVKLCPHTYVRLYKKTKLTIEV
jgi:hypothetical protein